MLLFMQLPACLPVYVTKWHRKAYGVPGDTVTALVQQVGGLWQHNGLLPHLNPPQMLSPCRVLLTQHPYPAHLISSAAAAHGVSAGSPDAMVHRFLTSFSLGQGCRLLQPTMSSASAAAATSCSSLYSCRNSTSARAPLEQTEKTLGSAHSTATHPSSSKTHLL